MSTLQILAQIVMVITLILMITGKTPIYLTAIVGATIAALVAGFPLTGTANVTVAKMVIGGLNPVIADMTGILLFIGIMQSTGFLDVIVRDIVRMGDKIGQGTGIACAGGIAAGAIGALTGFTQPVITGVVTGPAATRLGVNPNNAAGIIAHAGHIGNLAGFTHPTQVAILATAGIGYGMFNVYGFIAAISIFAMSAFRNIRQMKQAGIKIDKAEHDRIMAEINNKEYTTTSLKAFMPFIVLVVGFLLSFPIFQVGVAAALTCMVLAHKDAKESEKHMMEGVSLIAVPLVATIGFLFMSTVIKQIGMVTTMGNLVEPVLNISPVLVMFGVAFLTAFMTQSYAASVAIVVPFLQVVLNTGADHMAAAFAAASGAALIQYFLTGGPVAALSTVIPVVPGSDLKLANKFQRPSILFGCFVSLCIVILLMMF
ncbi:MAG: SLC13 family permease [Sutterella sp.]|nr:SLC13 family permease [Sutterella sp.]